MTGYGSLPPAVFLPQLAISYQARRSLFTPLNGEKCWKSRRRKVDIQRRIAPQDQLRDCPCVIPIPAVGSSSELQPLQAMSSGAK